MSKLILGGSIYSVLFEPDLDDELKKFIQDVVEDSGTSEEHSLYSIDEIKDALEGVEDKQLQEAFEELYQASKEHNFIFIELLYNESNQ